MKKYICEECKKQFKTERGYAEHLCSDELTVKDLELIKNVKVFIIENKDQMKKILESGFIQ